MKEQKLREAIRKQIREELQEYGTDSDPRKATAASGGSSTEWFQVARLFSDMAREYPEVKDVGQKQIGGETVHEIAINDRVYQLRKLQ